MSVRTPYTIRSRTITHMPPRMNGYAAAPVAARTDVASARPRGRRPLEDHLPEEEHERARHVEPVGEERAIAGVGPLLRLDPADREDHLVRLAGEEVAAAGAPVDEQPVPGGVLALDPRAVLGARSRSSSSPSPSRPSGRRGCRGWSRAGCRPGSHPSGTTGRAPTRAASACPRRASAPCSVRSRRASPAAARAARGRRSPGRGSPARRWVCAALPPRDALDDAQRVRVVVVRREDDLEDDAHRGDDDRREQRPPERVDGEALEHVGGELQDDGVQHQREQEAEHERERQPQRGERAAG